MAEELCKATRAEIEPGKKICISLNPPFLAGGKERMPITEFAALVCKKLSAYQEQDYTDMTHSASAVDITPRGVSKASAVQGLLTAAGLLPEEVLGVDDSAAGAEWLRVVGFRATPANGSPALDGIVHYRSPYPEVGGLIDILQKLAWHGYRPFSLRDDAYLREEA